MNMLMDLSFSGFVEASTSFFNCQLHFCYWLRYKNCFREYGWCVYKYQILLNENCTVYSNYLRKMQFLVTKESCEESYRNVFGQIVENQCNVCGKYLLTRLTIGTNTTLCTNTFVLTFVSWWCRCRESDGDENKLEYLSSAPPLFYPVLTITTGLK